MLGGREYWLGGGGEMEVYVQYVFLDIEIRVGIIPICIVHTYDRYISLQILQKAWISLKIIWKQERKKSNPPLSNTACPPKD